MTLTKEKKPAPRRKVQTLRDLLEIDNPEAKIRLMYAAKLAKLPRHTPEKHIPAEHKATALARDLVTGDYVTDYETVITALTG